MSNDTQPNNDITRWLFAPGMGKVRILTLAQALAAAAREHGLILTIEQHPTLPPAMGAHEDVVTVRRARTDGGHGE